MIRIISDKISVQGGSKQSQQKFLTIQKIYEKEYFGKLNWRIFFCENPVIWFSPFTGWVDDINLDKLIFNQKTQMGKRDFSMFFLNKGFVRTNKRRYVVS